MSKINSTKNAFFTMAGTAFLLLTISAAVLLSCGTGNTGRSKDYVFKDEFQSDGWVDENTFRISAYGVPDKGIINIIQKRQTAKKAALKSVHTRLFEMFKGPDIATTERFDEYYAGKNPEADNLSAVITKGKILSETYDEEHNCEIVYEITSPGLKKQYSRITGK